MEKLILFVDDEVDWRNMVTTYLQSEGYTVAAAKDATEAMRITEGMLLGLIILDVNLAGESGAILMKFLKHNHPGVPIVLFTVEKHTEEQVRGFLQQGAQRYVHKGGPLTDLLKAIKELFH
jgi:DNA-binding response OmpR family regulator